MIPHKRPGLGAGGKAYVGPSKDQGQTFERERGVLEQRYTSQVKLNFSRPGTPRDHALAESSNGKLRVEFLNESCFLSLEDAREKLELWRIDYSDRRPHSALSSEQPCIPSPFLNQDNARNTAFPSRLVRRPIVSALEMRLWIRS